MLNKLFFMSIFSFLITIVYAQNVGEFPCVNNVVTDFGEDSNQNPKATNDRLPLIGGNPDLRFLNGFDWVDGNVGNGSYSTNGMMFTENQPYGNMLNVKPQTQPAIDFYNYLWTGLDFSPEEGWELLLVNLGRYPDDVTVNSPARARLHLVRSVSFSKI